jgi:hypothetical protein
MENVMLLVTYGQVVILKVRKSVDNLLLQFLKRNFKRCDMLVPVGMMTVQMRHVGYICTFDDMEDPFAKFEKEVSVYIFFWKIITFKNLQLH